MVLGVNKELFFDLDEKYTKNDRMQKCEYLIT